MYKEKKWYLKSMWYKVTIMMITLVVWAIFMPLTASAANVTTGKMGENEEAIWAYDADTDTLVLTGQISGVGKLNNNFPNAKKVILKDCTLIGNISDIFKDMSLVESIEFNTVDTSNVTSMYSMFENCVSLISLDLGDFTTSNVTNMRNMFKGCKGLTGLNVSGFDTSNVKNMYGMFSGCNELTGLNLSNFDTGKVTDMRYMFFNCSGLSNLNLDGFDTANVIDMSAMFWNCSSLTVLDISDFNTGNVTSMTDMFRDCFNLSAVEGLDLSGFKTSKVKDMECMFYNCNNLAQLKLGGFNTENVTSMNFMFANCNSLSQLDISSFDTQNVTSMYSMFSGCSELKSLDVSDFNTSKTTNMYGMFQNCSGLTNLDVSNFDTTNVRLVSYMFRGCNNLTSLDISSFDMSNAGGSYPMLQGCRKIKTIKTPKAMRKNDQIHLPDNYYDAEGKKYTDIYSDGCNITLVRESSPFADVSENSWQYEYAKFALNKNMMTGKGTNAEGLIIFDPNAPLTRAEFVQTLYNKHGKPEVTYTDRFPDVEDGKWYTNAILWAAEENIVAGKGDGNFDVYGNITREEMATILYKYANYKQYNTVGRSNLDNYTDASSVSSWAVENMKWALSYGVMKGKGDRLAPLENATRAECATMLCNFMSYYEGY